MRKLSSCLSEKYNGFHVVFVEYRKRLRKKFKPIDIIYKPVKSPEKKFFSVITHKTYQNHIEIHVVVTAKKYRTNLILNAITAENFLQGLINKKDILKIAPVFLV